MVSSSRKKNKGKERKAKKIKEERDIAHIMWWGMATGDSKFAGQTTHITCDHGCSELPNYLDHPVCRFMNDLIVDWNRKSDGSALQKITSLFKTHTEIWNDDRNKKMVMNIMTRMGTNSILSGANLSRSLTIATLITLLENYDGNGCLNKTINSRGVATKLRDHDVRSSSVRRDALKFYSKRISCSCLKEMYQEARRTLPKTGICFGCQKEKERVALSVCSRCMIEQYCSRDCQVANWPVHKRDCGICVKFSWMTDEKVSY